ncbi:hypothetical protein ACFXPA_26150 [Amycolatopsis sp. NPDC059090]|uniref:hypothetical protein n=1 Tax=unclassified Amycolatopsis TaxID=2618356 RepID=UPI003672D897
MPGERFSPGNAEIVFVPVTDRAQTGDNGGQIVAAGDDDGQIDQTVRSMIGLAASPGTAVLPTCSRTLRESTATLR